MKAKLPSEEDWEAKHGFNFSDRSSDSVAEFLKKCQFRMTALRVAKSSVDVGRKNEMSKKKTISQSVTAILVKDTLTLCLESARSYVKLLCDRLIPHSLWKSDLVK